MNVALVHDYLNQRGGAERVFASIARAWPEAPVYTALYDRARDRRPGRRRTAYARRISRAFRLRTGTFARSRRSIRARSRRSTSRVSIRSSARRPHGRRACSFRPASVHVCYINTVSRFAFAYDEYVGGLTRSRRVKLLPLLARPLVDRLVEWDRRRRAAPDALRRELAQRCRAHSRVLRSRRGGAAVSRSTSIASASAAARAITFSSRRGCCRTSASSSRSTPRRLARREAARRGNRPVRTRAARTRARNDDDDARVRRRCDASTNCSATRAPRSFREKKTSVLCRSKRRPPGVRRSRIAAAARSKRSSKARPAQFFDEPSRGIAGARVARLRSVTATTARTLRAHAETFRAGRFIERLRAIVDRVRADSAMR